MSNLISDERAIANLIARYALLVDDGNYAAVGDLFACGELRLNENEPAVGRDAVETFLRDALWTYEDGTPRTRHVSSNIFIEIDESGACASASSYSTAFQATDGFPLQPIACGRYDDRFEQDNGRWMFTHRRITTGLVGDLHRHRR